MNAPSTYLDRGGAAVAAAASRPGSTFRVRLWVARLLVGVSVAAGLTAVSAPAALAAPCNGPSCVHVNPTTGSGACLSGAYDIETVTAPGGSASVTLRYSPSCTANWARLNSQTSGWNFYVQTYYDGHIENQIGPAYYFTYMVDGRQPARACIQGYSTYQWACTRWL